jgi:hypothetical protein
MLDGDFPCKQQATHFGTLLAEDSSFALLWVAQLLVPVGRTSLGGKVEQVPERLEGAVVAGILPWVSRRVEELRAPEVADRLAVAMEHVHHRHLVSVRGLAEVVLVIAVAGRGQEPQPPPAAFLGEGEDALQRGLRNDREVHALGGMLRGAVELIEESGARRARTLRERQERRLARLGSRPLVARVTGNIML